MFYSLGLSNADIQCCAAAAGPPAQGSREQSPSQAKANQPSIAKPKQAKAAKPKPKPEQRWPRQAKANQPSHAKASQAKVTAKQPSYAKSNKSKSSQSQPAKPKPSQSQAAKTSGSQIQRSCAAILCNKLLYALTRNPGGQWSADSHPKLLEPNLEQNLTEALAKLLDGPPHPKFQC